MSGARRKREESGKKVQEKGGEKGEKGGRITYQKVVAIHDGVHREVHGHKNDTRILLCVAKPGEQEDRHVVIPEGRVRGKEGGA